MQFLVLAYDYSDKDALNRRLAVRDAHLAGAAEMKERGELLYAAAMLTKQETMCGSMMVMCNLSREEIDQWLEKEPYMTGRVWERVEIIPCRVPDKFMSKAR
jgi:uncharacterized protein YciI